MDVLAGYELFFVIVGVVALIAIPIWGLYTDGAWASTTAAVLAGFSVIVWFGFLIVTPVGDWRVLGALVFPAIFAGLSILIENRASR